MCECKSDWSDVVIYIYLLRVSLFCSDDNVTAKATEHTHTYEHIYSKTRASDRFVHKIPETYTLTLAIYAFLNFGIQSHLHRSSAQRDDGDYDEYGEYGA